MLDGDTFDQPITKIKAAMTGQTNQTSMRHKLFTKMEQGDKPFVAWWTEVKDQSEKCDFTAYNSEKACKDAIVYQTSSKKLRKKALTEDMDLEAIVKLGVMEEQVEMKSESISGEKKEEIKLRRWRRMLLGCN